MSDDFHKTEEDEETISFDELIEQELKDPEFRALHTAKDILQIIATSRQIERDTSTLSHGRLTGEAWHTCKVLDAVAMQICQWVGIDYLMYEDMCTHWESKGL